MSNGFNSTSCLSAMDTPDTKRRALDLALDSVIGDETAVWHPKIGETPDAVRRALQLAFSRDSDEEFVVQHQRWIRESSDLDGIDFFK